MTTNTTTTTTTNANATAAAPATTPAPIAAEADGRVFGCDLEGLLDDLPPSDQASGGGGSPEPAAAVAPGTPGRAFLAGCGLTEGEIASHVAGYDDVEGLVIFADGGGRRFGRQVLHGRGPDYRAPEAGAEDEPAPLYNQAALEKTGPVFVFGEVTDAVIAEGAGYSAVALAGATAERAAEAVAESCYHGIVVCATGRRWRMDAGDGAPRPVVERIRDDALRDLLASSGVDAVVADVGPDAGAGADGRDGLLARLRRADSAARRVLLLRECARPGIVDPGVVLEDIVSGRGYRKPIPTGLRSLDAATGGGWRQGGVVVVGSQSSMGKTTVSLQLGDFAAAQGNPVLYATGEQGTGELVRKSLARLMARHPEAERTGPVSSSDIADPEKRGAWSPKVRRIFAESCERYREEIVPNLRFFEPAVQPTAAEIVEAAEALSSCTGKAPYVVVDYLQLLRSPDARKGERETIDEALAILRHLARDTGAVVLVISSLNRDSYKNSTGYASYKASGSIEYTADLLLALQPYRFQELLDGVTVSGDDDDQTRRRKSADAVLDEFRSSPDREIEIKVLKNREGMVGGTARLIMHCITSLVEDAEPAPADDAPGDGPAPPAPDRLPGLLL